MELIPTIPFGISPKVQGLKQSLKAFGTWASKTITNLILPSGSFTTLSMPIAIRWCARGKQTECSNEVLLQGRLTPRNQRRFRGNPLHQRTRGTMNLELLGYVELPANVKPGGFDHAAVHRASARLYVAHTANDALDVIDCVDDRYSHSIQNLTGVAGALVSDEENLVFTSNRGENTVGIFAPDDEAGLAKVDVGIRPNGLAYDPGNGLLLAANVGDQGVRDSFPLSMVNVGQHQMITSVRVPGRTRWTTFDKRAEVFYVNVADPAQIVVVASAEPTRVARTIAIPAPGP